LNGIRERAEWTSVQNQGNSVIDYIMCDQVTLEQVEEFKTWGKLEHILSDHRIISAKLKGRLREGKDCKERPQGGRKGGE